MKASRKISIIYSLITISFILIAGVVFYFFSSGYTQNLYYKYLEEKAHAVAEAVKRRLGGEAAKGVVKQLADETRVDGVVPVLGVEHVHEVGDGAGFRAQPGVVSAGGFRCFWNVVGHDFLFSWIRRRTAGMFSVFVVGL